jgi:trans-L-3-hydroxyproline dehydratase
MLEPRGHQDMYGVIRVEPSDPEADLAVLFMHNSGYSTMCGHATVAIGRWAVEQGLVAKRAPLTRFNLECPCGVVRVTVEVSERGVGEVAFESVPAFAAQIGLSVATPSFGRIGLDISFGGAFYAILPASRLKLSMLETPLERLIAAAREITAATRAQTVLEHPEAPDLAFLYGTILTDDAEPGSPAPSLNLCIFGEGQVDRSPTGSGVTARLALDHASGRLPIGAKRIFRGLTGEPFSGELLREARAGNRAAVIVRVGGRSYYSGTSTFTVEAEDPLRDGFPMPRTLAEIARK